ncbi:MAG: branched-chain amino acid ABC transporter ATP-binding protein [Candidatus Rokubacteria bacterium RIFCSPLOWO2_12_FULL_71_22]|nr:MAG: branched-chain amino acid ABC transporter ATP-binding protein [Candidatus Rokubacteria bacterium RIFCSPLOWO2_12_FULL_71_22]
MLELIDVHAGYGRAAVLQGVRLHVTRGEIVTLIGSNGAGKSTALRTISGLVPTRQGQIRFLGQAISDRPSHAIVRAGLAHVPEGRRLFGDMTVRENLLLGGYTCSRRESDERLARAYAWFPLLAERDRQLAGSLSGGEQQMVAIARGLMADPKLLLLDEPSLGLAPKLVAQVAEMIRTVRARGVTILLVEQNANLALQLCDRGYVLQVGRIVLEGAGRELLDDPFVRTAYLGL